MSYEPPNRNSLPNSQRVKAGLENVTFKRDFK